MNKADKPLSLLWNWGVSSTTGRSGTTPEKWKRDGLQNLQWAVKSGMYLKTWPFALDPDGMPRYDDSIRGRVAFRVNAAFSLVLFSFCSIRSVQAISVKNTPMSTTIYQQLMTTIHIIPVVFNLAGLCNGKHMACCMRFAIPFFEKYKANNPRVMGYLMYKALPWLQLGIRYGVNANSTLITIVLLTKPDSPENVLSVLPKSLSENLLVRLPVCVGYCIWMNSVRVNAVFVGVFFLYISIWCFIVLKDLSFKARYGEGDVVRIAAEWKTYRALQIIVKEFNKAILVLLPVVKLVVIVPSVLAAYAVIRLEGVTSWMCGIYAFDTALWLEVTLTFIAQLWVHSTEFLHSAKSCVSPKSVISKQLLGTSPCAVKIVDGMYFVDKKLVRTVTDIMLSNTVNILMIGKSTR